jgi:hypothetical protein
MSGPCVPLQHASRARPVCHTVTAHRTPHTPVCAPLRHTDRTPMTDYDMHDLIREQLTGIYVSTTALGLMPEQYDQRLTQALQLLRDARALLEECRG